MRILISSPHQVIYEGNVKEVVLPGEDGEFSVMDFHQPFLYRLRSGFIHFKGVAARILIKNGVARMLKNELVIMIEA